MNIVHNYIYIVSIKLHETLTKLLGIIIFVIVLKNKDPVILRSLIIQQILTLQIEY